MYPCMSTGHRSIDMRATPIHQAYAYYNLTLQVTESLARGAHNYLWNLHQSIQRHADGKASLDRRLENSTPYVRCSTQLFFRIERSSITVLIGGEMRESSSNLEGTNKRVLVVDTTRRFTRILRPTPRVSNTSVMTRLRLETCMTSHTRWAQEKCSARPFNRK